MAELRRIEDQVREDWQEITAKYFREGGAPSYEKLRPVADRVSTLVQETRTLRALVRQWYERALVHPGDPLVPELIKETRANIEPETYSACHDCGFVGPHNCDAGHRIV